MDILAARKKAAERALAQKKDKQEPAQIVQPVIIEPAPAADEPLTPKALVNAATPPKEEPSLADPDDAEEKARVTAVDSEPSPGDSRQTLEMEMLSFRLGEEEYAVMVDDVKEVLKNRELTAVPNAPDYILGVTSLRGPILPVIDLCKRLGIPSGVRDEKSRILVLSLKEEDAGIVVDRVSGVIRINPDTIRPVPETIERGAEFLKGIARQNDRLYILLDIEKALAS